MIIKHNLGNDRLYNDIIYLGWDLLKSKPLDPNRLSHNFVWIAPARNAVFPLQLISTAILDSIESQLQQNLADEEHWARKSFQQTTNDFETHFLSYLTYHLSHSHKKKNKA